MWFWFGLFPFFLRRKEGSRNVLSVSWYNYVIRKYVHMLRLRNSLKCNSVIYLITKKERTFRELSFFVKKQLKSPVLRNRAQTNVPRNAVLYILFFVFEINVVQMMVLSYVRNVTCTKL